MTTPVRVLMVEDSSADAKLIMAELRRSSLALEFHRVDDADAMRTALEAESWGVVLSDWSMPRFSGLSALEVLRQSGKDIPFIIVSGTVGEDVAVDAMRAGAHDYVLKDRLARLAPAIERELRECAVRQAQRRLEARFRAIAERSSDALILNRADGIIEYVSAGVRGILGLPPEELVGTRFIDHIHPADRAFMLESMVRVRSPEPDESIRYECRLLRRDGSVRWVEGTRVNMLADPAVGAVVGSIRDVTDRKLTADALRASEARFSRLAESGIIGIVLADVEGTVHQANDAYLKLVGYSREEVSAGKLEWEGLTPPEWRGHGERAIADLREGRQVAPWESELLRKDGTRVPILLGVAMLEAPMCIAFAADLTEKKEAERALRATEAELRHSQKMEAIGRLAGGVAHDFNNVLAVILCYAELAMLDLPPDDPTRGNVEEIQRAGRRAADLTRQLLMFSRKQVLAPTVLDLNDVVSGMARMLQRILGADVQLESCPLPSLGKVRVDRSSFEQVIMNLVVNARDAMPTGGKLTVSTDNVGIGEGHPLRRAELKPGRYVRLAVTDTGTGMDATTLGRMFEPFFTTKETGKGTGLGLSTVFGIVQQSGGDVRATSDVGKGTRVEIFLPEVEDPPEDARAKAQRGPSVRGTETILLVEDDDQVRGVARSILKRSGYDVIEARNGDDAIRSAEAHLGVIHLLLTDVVMPHMGGVELANRVTVLRPGLKVLYMSGYTDDSILKQGVEAAHVAYIQKPFTSEALARKVRDEIASTVEPPTVSS